MLKVLFGCPKLTALPWRVMTGRTPLGRRLAMVGGVDIVLTISGHQHTEVVVEQVLDLGLLSFLYRTLVAIRKTF
jgi:hypothetical protein